MTRARREQARLLDAPYALCIARCVRRAFLCGEDRYSGSNDKNNDKKDTHKISMWNTCTAIPFMHQPLSIAVKPRGLTGWLSAGVHGGFMPAI